eukprot:TRINITY_DN7876_c0_g1_i1.p1 TRINITY_DN7876_c0_g1~~TRINITY_DN7876_c0_g1_i1.p1  ORF type:complete len:577 (+),score=142.09 TRINITY_DN7876_c0_g1_i1:96-1733(+)
MAMNRRMLGMLIGLYCLVLFTVLVQLNEVPVTPPQPVHVPPRSQQRDLEAVQAAKLAKLVQDVKYLQRTPSVDDVMRSINEGHMAQRERVYPGGKYSGTQEDSIHLFYTCDCTQHSLWQVLGLERSWLEVHHPGAITRIVSGCVSETAVSHTNLKLLKRRNIDTDKLFVFFAPKIDTSAVPGPKNTKSSYAPLNRPASVLYWLTLARPYEDVLCLLDPDMVFVKPLYYAPQVRPGRPVGQYYDYLVSEDWDKQYLEICPDCPPLVGKKDFCPGPPHMMTRDDWVAVSTYWVQYTIEARRVWGKWVSEMVGMSIGMAKLDLRSHIVRDGMWDRPDVAEPTLRKNGLWDGKYEISKPVVDHHPLGMHPVGVEGLPCMLHYCFTPEIGRKTYPESFWGTATPQKKWEVDNNAPLLHYIHWSKYRVPGDWGGATPPRSGSLLDCKQELLFELPPLTYMLKKHSRTSDDKGWALMLSNILPNLNKGIMAYKERYCNLSNADGTKRKPKRIVRTAHPTFWLTDYEMVLDGSLKYGFGFKNINTGALVSDEA